MIGLFCGIVFLLMAGITVGWNFCVATRKVTKCAADGMAACQRKKAVLNIGPDPSGGTCQMAIRTIGGIPGLLMIRFGCRQIIGFMTVNALNSDRIKPPEGTGFMAGATVPELMGSGERKPALLMDRTYVFNDPGFRCMTSGTIRAEGILMQIIVTIHAFHFSGRENKRFVTGSAINRFMLPNEFIRGAVMIKCHGLVVNLPARGGMAKRTINLKTLAVRRLPEKGCYTEQ